jgi:membrane associated rhomboid family serine protease
VIPLRDVIPSRTTPVVTIAIIVLNALVFVYQVALGTGANALFLQFGLVPAAFSWVAVLTSMFLHGGWLHVGTTVLYLWIFGRTVEDRMGHGRFLAFYPLCGGAAALAHTAMQPSSIVPMVGASGAVAGVMGAYLVLYPHSRIVMLVPMIVAIQLVEVPAVVFLGLWFLLQVGVESLAAVSLGEHGGMAFWAHLAGFLAGAGGVIGFRRPERQRVEWWNDLT